ncbi:MAG: hypothetical protein KatS3mg061_0107 [Dehalococcoidia bacterium]|nr:MAG: hypothetical protein KatS3mg061_0107 [Dehalococcoidia bacterium]
MALTLTEAAKLSNDTLRVGVIETIVKESPILSRLPFISVLGNGLTYNRESTMAAADFYDVGDSWSESTPTFTQHTATLKILGGDADIDNFLARTRGNLQDLVVTVIEQKAKAVAHAFEESFLYGDSVANPKQFDGLHRLVPASQQVHQGSGTTPAPLSLANVDTLLDLIRPGKPDLLLMSRRTRRLISQYARSANSPVVISSSAFGEMVATYNGIPIAVSDFLSDSESLSGGAYAGKTGGTASSIFALKFGEDALAGLEGSDGIVVEEVGNLETKDARRFRVKWYCAIAAFSTLCLARIDGISGGTVTA